ncbi:hypothetical protein OAK75_14310 [Bacteriovoracales bacterium]|nr:hypothetical protein [Bacteriovoracales bacterium]
MKSNFIFKNIIKFFIISSFTGVILGYSQSSTKPLPGHGKGAGYSERDFRLHIAKSCVDVQLVFQDRPGGTYPRIITGLSDGKYPDPIKENPDVTYDRELSAVISCMGGGKYIPSMSILHFTETNEKEICFFERSCGNFDRWDGKFSFGFHWRAFNSVSEFFFNPVDIDDTDIYPNSGSGGGVTETGITVGGTVKDETKTKEIFLKFSFDWGKVERYCSDPSPKFCISKRKN